MSKTINRLCNVAFKEWSVIVEALLTGRQSLILRKGGIREDQGRFTIESREFFLYPTKVHQNPQDLVAVGDRELIQVAEGQIAPDHVMLRAFAQVEHYERLTDWGRVVALKSHHIWSEGLVDQRFHWGKEDWLDLFVLKVFRLSKPLALKNESAFAGCKSWIHFKEAMNVGDAVPVLSSGAFARESQAIAAVWQKT